MEQIKFLLGHSSIQTTERYLGSEQEIAVAVNDNLRGSEATLAPSPGFFVPLRGWRQKSCRCHSHRAHVSVVLSRRFNSRKFPWVIGFVHEYRPLGTPEIEALLAARWAPPGVSLPPEAQRSSMEACWPEKAVTYEIVRCRTAAKPSHISVELIQLL